MEKKKRATDSKVDWDHKYREYKSQMAKISAKVKARSTLLCAILEEFAGKKQDNRLVAGIDQQIWKLVSIFGEMKKLAASKIPAVKNTTLDKPVVEKEQSSVAAMGTWMVRADKMKKTLLRAIKYHHKIRFQEMMGVIKKYGPGRVTIIYDKNLKPVSYTLDF